MRRTYAVLGGDQRQLHLAELLRQDGLPVSEWGFDRIRDRGQSSLEEAVGADVIILPLPLTWDGRELNLPLSFSRVLLDDLWPLLDSRRQLICGGNLSPAVRAQTAAQRLEVVDYFDREEVQVGNAVPTAEGAIQAAMEAMDRTLHGAEVLVIGFGRIGKVLVGDLRGLGARVWVSARKYSDQAWAETMGCQTLHTERLAGKLGNFDAVFNTVPAPVLGRERLEELRPSCVVVDVASGSGGVNFAAADALGISATWARGLPGKVAPFTAAEVLRTALYHILEERGEPI